MKITSDPILKRTCTPSKDAAIFEQLTPEQNCLVLDEGESSKTAADRLYRWAKIHRPDCKVKTTKAYPTDRKPRVWLIFPTPIKTQIRGNFPRTQS